MSLTTIKCEICGRPYMVFPYYAGDQSACPRCRRKARELLVPSDASNDDSNKQGGTYDNRRAYGV